MWKFIITVIIILFVFSANIDKLFINSYSTVKNEILNKELHENCKCRLFLKIQSNLKKILHKEMIYKRV
jgi:hypothetical protein